MIKFNYIFYNRIWQVVFISCIVLSVQAQDTTAIHRQLQALPSDQEKVSYLESRIHEVLNQAPQQALYYTEIADALLRHVDSLAWKLEFQRLRALGYRGKGLYTEAVASLDRLLNQIPAHDTSTVFLSLRAKVYINQGTLYRRQGDMEQSASVLLQAARISDSLTRMAPQNTAYMETKSDALETLGITLAIMQNYEKSAAYLKQALAVIEPLHDEDKTASLLFNLGSVFFKADQDDSAEYYWQKGIQYADTVRQAYLLHSYYHNLGALETERKNWRKAESYFYQSIRIMESIGSQEGLGKLYEALANFYVEEGNYEKAEKAAWTAMDLVKENLENKIAIHQALAIIYDSTQQFRKAIIHYQTYADLQDSLRGEDKNRVIAEMEAKYQHEKQQQELQLQQQQIELLSRDNQIKQLSRNILALAFIMLLLAGFFLFRTKNLKMKRKQEQLEHSRTMLATQKENARLREQKLQQELDHRNQQLTSYTLNFIQKNELLEELKEHVEALQKQKQWTAHDFRSLRQRIQQHVSIDQDWENFKLHFEHVHPDFFRNLTDAFPDLGPSEMKLCALIRLNMNIKESALVLGISPDSVKTARHRLRRKMNLDAEDNITDILMQVEKGIFEREALVQA